MGKLILLIVTLNGSVGVINLDSGSFVIPATHDKIKRLNNDLFLASKQLEIDQIIKTKWGAYDYSGNQIIPFIYDKLSILPDSTFQAQKDSETFFLNKEGEVQKGINLLNLEIYNGENKITRFRENHKIGFCDSNYEVTIKPIYDWAVYNSNFNLYHVRQKGKKYEAILKQDGTELYKLLEDHTVKIGAFSNELILTYDDSKSFQCGLISYSLGNLIPNIYDDLTFNNSFYEQEPRVLLFGKNNSNGKYDLIEIINSEKSNHILTKDFIGYGNGEDYFVFGNEEENKITMGLIDANGQIIISGKYDELKYCSNSDKINDDTHKYIFKFDGLYGIVDDQGVELISDIEKPFRVLSNGLLLIERRIGTSLIDLNGLIKYENENIWIWTPIDGSETNYLAKDESGKYGVFNILTKVWLLKPEYERIGIPDIIEKKTTGNNR